MFANDRDLLRLEPNVFRDLSWVGQRLLECTGSISGTTLTLTGGNAASVGVDTAYIVMVNGVALEVLSRTSGTVLEVSKLREAVNAPAIPPKAVSNVPVVVTSFRPQIAMVHAQVLRMAGIEPDAGDGGPTEADILHPCGLAQVEALGAMHLIMSAGAPINQPSDSLDARVKLYRERFELERSRVVVEIDLNGDGKADARRQLHAGQFVRE